MRSPKRRHSFTPPARRNALRQLTAGELADRTGPRRGSIATLVSQLAQRGELLKAARGYQLSREKPDQGGPNQSGDRARSDPGAATPVQALRRELDAGLRA